MSDKTKGRRAEVKKRGIKLSFYDEIAGKSRHITVYGPQLQELAEFVQRQVESRWSSTKLNDRRHQRR